MVLHIKSENMFMWTLNGLFMCCIYILFYKAVYIQYHNINFLVNGSFCMVTFCSIVFCFFF